jgi:serine/threonine protein phosphatase PrpC
LVVESFEAMRTGPVTVADVTVAIDRCFASVDALRGAPFSAPGTTLVLLAYVREDDRDQWLLANIGDSRAYGLAAGALRLLSHDHSVVQEMIDAGEISEAEARVHPERHVITRSIGAMETSAPDLTLFEVVPGARFLLCSDGVTGELDDDEIARILSESATAALAVEQLIDAAVQAGGHDNVTALVIDVRVQRDSAEEDTLGLPSAVADVPGVEGEPA